MKISQKAKPKIEKRIELYAKSQGLNKEELENKIDEILEKGDVTDKEKAFELAVSELRRTIKRFIQMTPGNVVEREDRLPYYGFYALTKDGSEWNPRRVRYYPDSEEELEENVKDFRIGVLRESDGVIEMTRTNNEPITDTLTGNQMYGIKSAIDVDDEKDDELMEEFKLSYIELFDIDDESARETLMEIDSWEELAETIEDYETVKIGIFQTLQHVDTEGQTTEDGDSLKARLSTKGQVTRRGEVGTHDIMIYFDTDADLIEFKNKHEIPFQAETKTAWIPTTIDDEGNERNITSRSTGDVVYAVKNLEITADKEETLKKMDDGGFHVDISSIHDPNSDMYIEPDAQQQGIEFVAAIRFPYMMVDATDSVIRGNDQPRLNAEIFNEDVTEIFSGKAYGATAHDIVGSGDKEEFLSNVDKMHGAVAKDVKAYCGRMTYENDDGELVSHWIIYGIHDYDEPTDTELEEFESKLDEL